jgi:hypothetical protein
LEANQSGATVSIGGAVAFAATKVSVPIDDTRSHLKMPTNFLYRRFFFPGERHSEQKHRHKGLEKISHG